jgi:uncharacterized integral membrane protein
MTDDHSDPFEVEPESPAERETGRVPTSARAETSGIAWGAFLLLIGIALVIVFAVQNTDPVPVTFLWMEGQFSLAFVILVTIGVIILLTELIGLSYRKRRRRRRADSEELRKYRDS